MDDEAGLMGRFEGDAQVSWEAGIPGEVEHSIPMLSGSTECTGVGELGASEGETSREGRILFGSGCGSFGW